MEPLQAHEASRRTVILAEKRVNARRRNVQAISAAIRQKTHRRVASAGMLIAAFGVGVALEQIKRRHAWWLVSLLGAARTIERLVNLSMSLVGPPAARPPATSASDPRDSR
jgi:hypothetical protein